jgi:Transcriptional regulator
MIDAALFPALETLLAVAGTGSVAAAARQRHITSSAVSQQIRRLEAHFGIKLFERGRAAACASPPPARRRCP